MIDVHSAIICSLHQSSSGSMIPFVTIGPERVSEWFILCECAYAGGERGQEGCGGVGFLQEQTGESV